MPAEKNKQGQKEEVAKQHENAEAGSTGQNPVTEAAHQQADADIAKDPEFNAHSPNDDLDEEESARLGDDTSLV